MRTTEEQAVSVIPIEIFLEILGYVVDWRDDYERRETLLNLALVCQSFYTATLPHLFDSLHIDVARHPARNFGIIDRVEFCRALDNGTERATSLAYHVKECTLVGWRFKGDRASKDESLIPMFCRAFQQMPNLHTIILEHVTIYSPLLQTIDNLQSLRSLSLCGCDFDDALINPQTEPPEIFSDEPIRTMLSLIYFLTKPTSISSKPQMIKISTRAVHINDRKRLPANDFNMTLPLFPQGTAMVELHLVDMESTTTTWTIIASLNALQTLNIQKVLVPLDHTHPRELWASCLPHLQRLNIPPSFTYIVAGRPIASLDLGPHEYFTNPHITGPKVSEQLVSTHFSHIMQSSADIVNLTIPVKFYLLEPLHKTFPALKTLCIMRYHRNFSGRSDFTDFINQVATKWPPAPSLRSLNLPGVEHPLDLVTQRDYIPQLTSAFPNVNIIRFMDQVEWTKHPHEDKWTGYIPRKFRHDIDQMIRTSRFYYYMRDVDELLEPFIGEVN